MAVVFIGLHVLTAVTDSYVNIPLTAVVVPLASPYEPIWVGLGAVSLDITVAVVVTSLLRRHLSRRVWRAVHLLAYLSWPVAWLHSITASHDLLHGWMFVIGIGCALLVVVAVGWRLAAAARDVPRAQRVSLLMSAVHDRTSQRPQVRAGRRAARKDQPPMTAATTGMPAERHGHRTAAAAAGQRPAPGGLARARRQARPTCPTGTRRAA